MGVNVSRHSLHFDKSSCHVNIKDKDEEYHNNKGGTTIELPPLSNAHKISKEIVVPNSIHRSLIHRGYNSFDCLDHYARKPEHSRHQIRRASEPEEKIPLIYNQHINKRRNTELSSLDVSPKSTPIHIIDNSNTPSRNILISHQGVVDGSDTGKELTNDTDTHYEEVPSSVSLPNSPIGSHTVHYNKIVSRSRSLSIKKPFVSMNCENDDRFIGNRRSGGQGASPVVNLPWNRSRYPEEEKLLRARLRSKSMIHSALRSTEPTDLNRIHRSTRTEFIETRTLTKSRDKDGRKTLNQYSVLRLLGTGNFGKVKLGSDVNNGELVAIKIIRKSNLKEKRRNGCPNEREMNCVAREISILRSLEHENVITLKEVIDDPIEEKLYLVFEYVDGGVLREVKMDGSVEAEPMPENSARTYFVQLLKGLQYLHSNQILHRDIKPSNILISKSGCLKISDFGVSRSFSGIDDTCSDSIGTPAFLPPEACGVGIVSGRSADIWSCGVTLFAMIFGEVPFKGSGIGPGKLFSLYQAIQHSPIQLPFDVTEELKDLFRRVFAKEPSLRISLEELLVHPWVIMDQSSLNTEKLEVVTSSEGCSSIESEAKIPLIDRFVLITQLKGRMAEKKKSLNSKLKDSSNSVSNKVCLEPLSPRPGKSRVDSSVYEGNSLGNSPAEFTHPSPFCSTSYAVPDPPVGPHLPPLSLPPISIFDHLAIPSHGQRTIQEKVD